MQQRGQPWPRVPEGIGKQGMTMTSQWTPEGVALMLSSNNRAVEKGILALWDRQTPDEKSAELTKHSNGVGFNLPDSHMGTKCAKWIKAGKSLTGWHLAKARELTIKYRGQLCDLAIAGGKPCPPAYIVEKAPKAPRKPRAPRSTSVYESQRECASRCDNCSDHAQGVEYYSMGTPVLFLCHKCTTR